MGEPPRKCRCGHLELSHASGFTAGEYNPHAGACMIGWSQPADACTCGAFVLAEPEREPR